MNIDWAHFTPWTSLAGGILLGIASAMMVLLSGRILGISGILGGLLAPRIGDIGWRVAFLLGMGASPMVFAALMPPELLPVVRIDASEPLIALAGVLVGLGTRYGSGCTSGHGVCGLSRLSPRSLVATLCFMAAGFAVVYLLRHAF
jgi:uncharacterized membrane protein YedE/YeeE